MKRILMLATALLLWLCFVGGCANMAESKAMDIMLKEKALATPLFELTGTNISITAVGTETAPARFIVYNPEIAATIAMEEKGTWAQLGSFFGGVLGGYFAGGASTEATATSNEVVTASSPRVIVVTSGNVSKPK